MATKTQILISARDGASAVFGKVARNSTRAQKKIFGVNSALKSTDKSVMALSSTVKGLAVGAGAAFGLGALASSLKEAVAVKIEYDKINNVLKAVTGSSKDAKKEFNFIADEAERLGLELRPLAQSYTRLAAAGNQLGLSTKDTREIFTSFSEALTGFGATREQSIRVFTAIEQILSKGKVSAEELRQQLGEALPGAFQLAAKAVGVTVQELDGMLKRGELLSSEFILPYAKVIRQEFGGAALEGAKLLNAEFGKTLNVLDKVKLAFVEGGQAGTSLADSLASILKKLREFIGNEERLERFAQIGQSLGTGLELAAKSIQTITNVISSIPSEALIALGAVALGGSRTKGASAAAIQALSPVVSAPVAQRSAFDTIRGQRNFLPSVVQGQLSGGTSGYIRGLMSGRTEWGDARESDRRARRDAWRRASSRPRSKYNTDVSYKGPDNLTQIGPVLSQLTGQQKLAEGFQKTFVPAVEKANKSIKERLSPTLSKVGTGITKVAGAFKGLSVSLLGVFSPVNLLIGGLGVLAGKFFELREEQEKIKRFEALGERSQAGTIAARAVMRQNRAGTFDAATAITEAKREANALGLTITQELVNFIVKGIEKGQEARKQAFEKVSKEDREATANLFALDDEAAEIRKYAQDIRELGLERADEIQKTKELAEEIRKKNNLTAQEAQEAAKDRVRAEKEVSNAKKSVEEQKKAEEQRKKTTQSIKEFTQGTINLQKENIARVKGVSEASIEAARQVREYTEVLKKQGVTAEQAKKLAEERVKAENKANKIKSLRAETRQSRAVGVARDARSVEVATQRQQRVEEQRFRQSQDLLTRTADSLNSIEETINNLSLGVV